jgi:hypothetical protein
MDESAPKEGTSSLQGRGAASMMEPNKGRPARAELHPARVHSDWLLRLSRSASTQGDDTRDLSGDTDAAAGSEHANFWSSLDMNSEVGGVASAAERIEPGSREVEEMVGLRRALHKLTKGLGKGDAEHLPYIFSAWGLWVQDEQRARRWLAHISDPAHFSKDERQAIIDLAREVLPKAVRRDAIRLQTLKNRLKIFSGSRINPQCFLHAFGGE